MAGSGPFMSSYTYSCTWNRSRDRPVIKLSSSAQQPRKDVQPEHEGWRPRGAQQNGKKGPTRKKIGKMREREREREREKRNDMEENETLEWGKKYLRNRPRTAGRRVPRASRTAGAKVTWSSTRGRLGNHRGGSPYRKSLQLAHPNSLKPDNAHKETRKKLWQPRQPITHTGRTSRNPVIPYTIEYKTTDGLCGFACERRGAVTADRISRYRTKMKCQWRCKSRQFRVLSVSKARPSVIRAKMSQRFIFS